MADHLQFSYNSLNLLSGIKNSSGGMMDEYFWGADGVKRTVRRYDRSSGREYTGSLIYQTTKTTRSLESIDFGEGRIVFGSSGRAVNYHITDHLGSVRCIVNPSGAVVAGSQSDYTPFGERYSISNNITAYRYQYNGKERQSAGGQTTSLLDFGARMYNPQIAQWCTVDPKAEKYYSISPYTYCANNPINIIDPDGKDIWELNLNGEIVKRIEDKTQDSFYIVQRVGDGWQRMESISFDRQIVSAVRRPMVTMEANDGSKFSKPLTIFEVQGDDNASKLFEFLGNVGVTTNVEWSHVKIGTWSSGRNIVGTTHGFDYSAVNGYVLQRDYTIREDNHSHVYNNAASKADVKQAERLNKVFPNAKSYNYFAPLGYTLYNENTPTGKELPYTKQKP